MNEKGRRIGEGHQNSVISDELVDKMRSRHEDDGLGYRKIAREFGLTPSTVAKICTYQRRAQTPERWKTVKDPKARKAAPDLSSGYRRTTSLWALAVAATAHTAA